MNEITPDTAQAVQTMMGMSDNVVITAIICVTIIVLAWLYQGPAVKIRKGIDGVTLKLGDVKTADDRRQTTAE